MSTHKNNNGRAHTFIKFIDEAYIDDSGELKDFSLSDQEKFELSAYDQSQPISDFLVDSGAREVSRSVEGAKLKFTFRYGFRHFYLELNMDEGEESIYAEVKDDGKLQYLLGGDGENLLEYLKARGLGDF